MMMTTKGRYALMAMVDLAMHNDQAPVTLQSVATRQEVTPAYLEQLFARLRRAGLVASMRGPGGGYRLAQEAHTITVADVVVAVDEPMKMTRCNNASHEGCMSTKARCLTHDVWEGLGQSIESYLRSISLADICRRAEQKDAVQKILAERPPLTQEQRLS